MRNGWILSYRESGDTFIPTNDDSDVYERKHEHLRVNNWSNTINHPENRQACAACKCEFGNQKYSHFIQQLKWSHINNQPRSTLGNFHRLDAEPSQNCQTNAIGTTQLDQSVSRKRTSSNQPAVSWVYHERLQTMVPYTERVLWFWHLDQSGKTNLQGDSQTRCTWKNGPDKNSRGAQDVPLTLELGQLPLDHQGTTKDRTSCG